MAENSNIGWTDHTMNFWQGCDPQYIEIALGRLGGLDVEATSPK